MMWLVTDNRRGCVPLAEIPLLDYGRFYDDLDKALENPACHVVNYFGVPVGEGLALYCLLADDNSHQVHIAAHNYGYYEEGGLESLAARHPAMHVFEREIAERWGLRFNRSPWAKPLRFPFDRANRESTIDNYPFYKMEGESLHEVNVGPIHAGIIEPGAFRFICNGEKVLHLEIALGYQHRGVESLMTATGNRVRQSAMADSIAGDSAVAHSTAYSLVTERLCGGFENYNIDTQRIIALELERIAMHIADTGALCMDIAYQLGQVTCEALRTVVINTTQLCCGNRFGKGFVRPFGTYYPLTDELIAKIIANLDDVRRRYDDMRRDLKSSPSVLARFEECGTVDTAQMQRIGAVGMAARASGLQRDIRLSHPWGAYCENIHHEPIVRSQGDVMARLMVRSREVLQSIDYITDLLREYSPAQLPTPDYDMVAEPSMLAFSLVEGWRGGICHAAVTDTEGTLTAYKIKDPSLHNWMALALSVRDAGISDFPVCNKSFNLSYCGHDL